MTSATGDRVTTSALDELIQQRRVSRGHRGILRQGLACGHPDLDAQLPQGWPVGELTEILAPYPGIGELQLLGPALAELTRQQQRIALVAPPRVPHAAGLRQLGLDLDNTLIVSVSHAQDVLWAAEQVLRSGVCGAVLCWPDRLSDRQLRRLQLAAEQGRCSGIAFRHLKAQGTRSPAALRMTLEPLPQRALRATIIKHRGGRPGKGFDIQLSS